MNISSYSDLLSAAASQAQPQRLLFAFAKAELPNDAGAVEQERFAAKQGGALAPVMCVDKLVDDLSSFEKLVEESRQTGAHWDIVFVSSLSGRNGQAPGQDEAEAPLKMMIESIRNGQIGNFLAFNREGDLVQFH
jgi:hypothetical protein